MRLMDSHEGSEPRIPEPDVCPDCRAESNSRINPEDDHMSLDITFACGAVVRWKSVLGSRRSESLHEVIECPSALPGLIAAAMKEHPHLRLGQLMSNVAQIASPGTDIFHVSNGLMAEGLRKMAEPRPTARK